jgi:hypothetical protein
MGENNSKEHTAYIIKLYDVMELWSVNAHQSNGRNKLIQTSDPKNGRPAMSCWIVASGY